MSEFQLKTPIAFLVFNRPDTTIRVFEEIRRAQPPKLLVVADGPRPEHPGEAEQCAAARAIVEQVDWDCVVLRNYAETNMGCRLRVSTGLDWVFANEEEAIILEDDCLPHPTFFRFCEELLERYRDDERVTMISGDNFQFGKQRTPYSYYFSRYVHVWGWASWRRAWQNYNVNIELWPEIKEGNWLQDLLGNRKAVRYWTKGFDQVYQGKIDTWDYQWTFASWVQNGMNVIPKVNLVSNIGFSKQATHTTIPGKTANMTISAMDFPLSHPTYLFADSIADKNTEKLFFIRNSFMIKALKKLKKSLINKSK